MNNLNLPVWLGNKGNRHILEGILKNMKNSTERMSLFMNPPLWFKKEVEDDYKNYECDFASDLFANLMGSVDYDVFNGIVDMLDDPVGKKIKHSSRKCKGDGKITKEIFADNKEIFRKLDMIKNAIGKADLQIVVMTLHFKNLDRVFARREFVRKYYLGKLYNTLNK